MTYRRTASDVAYRKVPLKRNELPEYKDFQTADQQVDCPQDFVLEILHDDGTSELVYDYEIKTVTYRKLKDGYILLSECPTARLWLKARSDGSNGMLYKIPSVLPVRDGGVVFRLCGGSGDFELVGDRYFSAAHYLG